MSETGLNVSVEELAALLHKRDPVERRGWKNIPSIGKEKYRIIARRMLAVEKWQKQ